MTADSRNDLERANRNALKCIDDDVRHKLGVPGAPPIIGLVNIKNPDIAIGSLAEYLSGNPNNLKRAMWYYLYATCWSIATILRRKYNNATEGEGYAPNAVYPLLAGTLNIPFSVNGPALRALREGFDTLHQRMGISQPPDTRNVEIYLAQAGVAEGMLEHLAIAFLRQERHFGLPSEGSSQDLNQWEDDALTFLPEGVRSPCFAVELDETGWHAALYTKIKNQIRNGDISSGEHFEITFREAIKTQNDKVSSRGAAKIIPRPRLCWNDNGLGLYVPRLEGRLKFYPKSNEPDNRLMLRGGEVWPLVPPWPTEMSWQNEKHGDNISFLRDPCGIAIFDRQKNGRFVCEVSSQKKPGPLNVVEAVLLCRQSFSVDGEASHMMSENAHVASLTLEVRPKNIVTSDGNFDLELQPRRRITAIGDAVAKNGQRILYGPNVQFRIETGQKTAGKRNLRISTERQQESVFLDLSFDDTGTLFISLSEILSALAITDPSVMSSPLRLRMELLGPGEDNIGGVFVEEFRVWPNVDVDNGGFLLKTPHPPANLSFKHCQYIKLDSSGQICLDRDGGYSQACLAFEIDKTVEQFYLPYPDVTCVRHTAGGQKRFLPYRSKIVLREEERFDTITIRCPDNEADLLVRGKMERTPFFKGSPRNIALRDLMQTSGDARVLIRKNNGVDIELFSVIESLKPIDFSLRKLSQDGLQLTLETLERIDAFQVTLEDEFGQTIPGEVALKHRQVDGRPVKWLTGEIPLENSQQLILRISPKEFPEELLEGLRLAKILVRPEGQEIWKRLGTQRGDVHALLFDATEISNPDSSDKRRFQTISQWMAHCYASETWKEMESCLYHRWQELGERLFSTPEGRNTVLAAAMANPPEDAAPSWVPISHPLTFLPQLYSVPWQHFESLAVCENEDIQVLSVVAEVASGSLHKDTLHSVVMTGFPNLMEASANGKPLQGFNPELFLQNIQHNQIDDDPSVGWFWRGKPFLGPGHWRAAHIRFDERIETVGLFGEQSTHNSKRQTSLLKLMSHFKHTELQPPVPKIADEEPNELNHLVATTLCAFAKEARVGCVTDWATRTSQILGCSREYMLQDIAFLLRLAPELFAFYMGVWQLTLRETEELAQQEG